MPVSIAITTSTRSAAAFLRKRQNANPNSAAPGNKQASTPLPPNGISFFDCDPDASGEFVSTVSCTDACPLEFSVISLLEKLQVTEYGSEPHPSAILSVKPSCDPRLIVRPADCVVGMLSVVGFSAIVNSVACDTVTVTAFETDGAFSASPL